MLDRFYDLALQLLLARVNDRYFKIVSKTLNGSETKNRRRKKHIVIFCRSDKALSSSLLFKLENNNFLLNIWVSMHKCDLNTWNSKKSDGFCWNTVRRWFVLFWCHKWFYCFVYQVDTLRCAIEYISFMTKQLQLSIFSFMTKQLQYDVTSDFTALFIRSTRLDAQLSISPLWRNNYSAKVSTVRNRKMMRTKLLWITKERVRFFASWSHWHGTVSWQPSFIKQHLTVDEITRNLQRIFGHRCSFNEILYMNISFCKKYQNSSVAYFSYTACYKCRITYNAVLFMTIDNRLK